MIDRSTNIKAALRSRQRGFLLNPYRFGISDGDPYWSNVVALLHMDGSEGGTSFPDQKGKIWTKTGTVTTTGTNAKFAQSAHFVGSSSWLDVAPSSDFSFGTGDFTIEFWVRYATYSGNNAVISFANNFTLYASDSGQFYVYNGSANILNMPRPALNTWTHIALSKVSGVSYLCANGGLHQSGTYAYNITSTNMRIGNATTGASPMLDGLIDDVRITKGVGRYTASYTVPTKPFPNH